MDGLTREGIISRLDELLEAQYASAPLGNLEDPLDELIYIILSIQTGPNSYQQTFSSLKERFPKWDLVVDSPDSCIEKILRPSGLSRQKSKNIRAIVNRVLEEVQARGQPPARASLDFLASESDEAAEAFLVSLPGVSKKTARCVLMFALGRNVFPVDTHIYRIFSCLGLIDSVHRKQAGDLIQNMVPTKMRRRLHINLIHHGRAICTSRKPKCSECFLISFCRTGMEQFRRNPKASPVAVDIFAGVGGLSVGFREAGYNIVFAADLDRHAAQTYRFNNPGIPMFEMDVACLRGDDILATTGLDKGGIDVLIGGPPCQGYSQAGKRNPGHCDNHLYRHFARLGNELGVHMLVMENVPGIRNVSGKPFIKEIRYYLRRKGFETRDFLMNAAEFGVPQNRKRVLILGTPRSFLPRVQLSAPPACFRINGINEAGGGVEEQELPVAPSVGEAFHGLPTRDPGEGRDVDEWLGEALYNHVAMAHSEGVVAKIQKIKAGEGPISYRRLIPDEPARTVIAGHRALPVHPFEDRTITAREAARLQSFKDDFRFLGPRGHHPLQIANAVPPSLAKAVAEHLKPWLL